MARAIRRESVIQPVPPPSMRKAVLPARAADQEAIARRAYERFQMRGGDHGHDQEDWFAAEREVSGADGE